jgi:1,4-dihydroxy-2-naphthoate octaprenyltransferase
VALGAALFFAALALVAAIGLAWQVRTGPLTIPLLALALFLAWEYSAPPLRLHSRGLGELTVAVLVPTLVPLVGYYLQAGRLALLPLLATFPLACFQFVMLLAIEFPDAIGDRAAGKDTLVVRLGGAWASRLLRGVLLLAYLYLPFGVAAGLPLEVAVGLALFSLPIASWLLWRLHGDGWALPNLWPWLGFFTLALLIGSAAVALLIFAWLYLRG